MAEALAPRGTTLLLDPALVIRPATLQFRAPQAFADQGFTRLKSSIAQSAGNVQPIKVRPLHGGGHELVFGTRRLRACLELGLPVAAVVQELTGTRVVEELDASNDVHQVSLYERGCLYAAALHAGYYPSRHRLADALGRSFTDVTNAVMLAQLPQIILDRVTDPRVLKIGTAKRLSEAAKVNPTSFAQQLSALRNDRTVTISEMLEALKVLNPQV